MRYVTYDENGILTGSYSQDLVKEHKHNHFVPTDAQADNWTAYRMNDKRNALVLADAAPQVQPALASAIPMLNLHLVLIEDGHLLAVENAIAAMPGDAGLRARAYWSKALTARIDNPLVSTLWPLLYDSEADFNTAWARAASLDPDSILSTTERQDMTFINQTGNGDPPPKKNPSPEPLRTPVPTDDADIKPTKPAK